MQDVYGAYVYKYCVKLNNPNPNHWEAGVFFIAFELNVGFSSNNAFVLAFETD